MQATLTSTHNGKYKLPLHRYINLNRNLPLEKYMIINHKIPLEEYMYSILSSHDYS